MAESNSHKLGQIIGDTLERAIEPHLADFARRHRLYLDQKGPRPCRASRKVSWADINGSSHDLDFVLERNGTGEVQGPPVAFIETAWRRYTRHSRAKAQEIQGAIEPLAAQYHQNSPFKGVVIAGVFTAGALSQLRGLGFKVVHVPYETVVQAFAARGVDVSFDEDTSERALGRKVAQCARLTPRQRQAVANAMLPNHNPDLSDFLSSLTATVERRVSRVTVLALFGSVTLVASIAQAVTAIETFQEESAGSPLNRYEIRVEFSNDDYVEGNFQSKADAVAFLRRTGG